MVDMVLKCDESIEKTYQLFERRNDTLYAEGYLLIQGQDGEKEPDLHVG